MGLSACSSVRPPTAPVGIAAPSTSSRAPTRTELDLARERLAQVTAEHRATDLDWSAALVVTAGGTPMLTVPRADGSWLVVGLDRREAVVAEGRLGNLSDGTVHLTTRNFSADTERSTRITAQGALVSENVTGRAPRLTALYTCAELRDRVDDARDDANDAKVQMAIAVATVLVTGPASPLAVAGTSLALGYLATRVVTTEDDYRNEAKRYHASCA